MHHKSMVPIRIQFTVFNKLRAEVIVHQFDVSRTHAAYQMAKYRKHMDAGGALTMRADGPRYFNVPVGSDIN
jgi:hypothetical protein